MAKQKKARPRGPRNPMARALRDPLFRRRVVRSAKAYSRKGRRAAREGLA